IGTGKQAKTQVLALSRVCDIRELRVFGRDVRRREAFAHDRQEELGLRTIAAHSAEAAVRGADVVVTMTTSAEPVLDAASVESHGLAIWDLAAASVVLPAAQENGLGEEIAFFAK